jgi:hypothetical protein
MMLKQMPLVTVPTILLCGTVSVEWIRSGGAHKNDGHMDMTTIAPTDKTVMR